jgi:predicted transcriptional regulator YdeE
MEPKIVERTKMMLVGLEYYGPLTGEGWSEENTIGQLWGRYTQIWEKREAALAGKIVHPEVSYELGIWNEEEFQTTKNFYIFVGAEVDPAQLDDLPLELVVRILPGGTYASATPKGKEIGSWEGSLYNEWLPQSGYRLAVIRDYSFQIQAYEQGRFKGAGEQLAESEIGVYVPVVKA